MSRHTLFIVCEPHKRYGHTTVITSVKRKKPKLPRPTEQAIVKLEIDLPDGIFNPRVVNVVVAREHITPPVPTAKSAPA